MNTVLLCCVTMTMGWLAGTLGSHLYTIHFSSTNIAYITLPDLPVLLYAVIKPTVSLGQVKEWVEGTLKIIECHLNEFCCCVKILTHFADVRQLNESIYMIRVLINYCLE